MTDSTPTPQGLQYSDAGGRRWVDATVGRICALGLGQVAITNAMVDAAAAAVPLSDADSTEFAAVLVDAMHGWGHDQWSQAYCLASSDDALELAIRIARTRKPTGGHKIVSLVGSDHGRTAACLTASGQPELHEGYGPMVAGFAHVAPNDVDALHNAVDGQTAAILLSPLDLSNAASPLSEDYLIAARQLCDEHDALLIIDETKLCFGASGQCLTVSSLAELAPDVAVIAAGLFTGLPGAIVLGNDRMRSEQVAIVPECRSSLIQTAAVATLATMRQLELPNSAVDAHRELAVALAKRISGFDFLRDIHHCGATIGIDTDLPAEQIIQAATKTGLCLGVCGQTAVLMQLPLIMEPSDQQELLDRIGETMEIVERETAQLTTASD
ncbi:aminotransferase class III-fold pyridoxal phosphate-dependent enzyme [Stieleria varia]|uniref:Acetylornithine aminotransferase n=1 Tax=Stieleria varia TaxID=2528005 RepID=A0A5C6A1T5_9BACT|nr:aminotransferase class III-fold pyridoxal phosphate-dependent enzyme [Stieleria varia]TWT93247.1 Acetylornithine aminotransferase [Stieleria varia]